jgi:hypothetical protein
MPDPTDLIEAATDSVTETTTVGWGGRIKETLIGALVGPAIIAGGIWLLVWNEGRAVEAITALNAGQRTVVTVPPTPVDPSREGALIHVMGTATVQGPVRDRSFQIEVPDALRLRRVVEMYQWEENETTRTERSVGGSETRTTTYEYNKVWSEKPIDSSRFKVPRGHGNPAMPYRTNVTDAPGPKLGAFAIDAAMLDRLSTWRETAVTPAANGPRGYAASGDGLYRGADPSQPAIGDVRVRFEMIPVGLLSAVGRQTGQTLTPYAGPDGYEIKLLVEGARDSAAMFAQAKSDENLLTWVLRLVGLILACLGFFLLMKPISMLVAFVPLLEDIVDFGIGFVAMLLGLSVTVVTIALAWLAYRPLTAVGIFAFGAAMTVALAWWRRRARAAAAGRPAHAG